MASNYRIDFKVRVLPEGEESTWELGKNVSQYGVDVSTDKPFDEVKSLTDTKNIELQDILLKIAQEVTNGQ